MPGASQGSKVNWHPSGWVVTQRVAVAHYVSGETKGPRLSEPTDSGAGRGDRVAFTTAVFAQSATFHGDVGFGRTPDGYTR